MKRAVLASKYTKPLDLMLNNSPNILVRDLIARIILHADGLIDKGTVHLHMCTRNLMTFVNWTGWLGGDQEKKAWRNLQVAGERIPVSNFKATMEYSPPIDDIVLIT